MMRYSRAALNSYGPTILTDIAARRGLPVEGTRTDLIARILQQQDEARQVVAAPEPPIYTDAEAALLEAARAYRSKRTLGATTYIKLPNGQYGTVPLQDYDAYLRATRPVPPPAPQANARTAAAPGPGATKVQAIEHASEELQALDKPSIATARKVLRSLIKQGIRAEDIEGVESSLEDVASTVRSDYDSSEDYQDARMEAWESFVNALDDLTNEYADEEDDGDALAGPGTDITDYLHPTPGGVIVDPGLARSTPCIRVELGSGRTPLIYSKGVIGALNDEEEAAYCAEGYIEHTPSPAQLARIEALSAAAAQCSVETADTGSEHIDAYFSCLGRELKAKGMQP